MGFAIVGMKLTYGLDDALKAQFAPDVEPFVEHANLEEWLQDRLQKMRELEIEIPFIKKYEEKRKGGLFGGLVN